MSTLHSYLKDLVKRDSRYSHDSPEIRERILKVLYQQCKHLDSEWRDGDEYITSKIYDALERPSLLSAIGNTSSHHRVLRQFEEAESIDLLNQHVSSAESLFETFHSYKPHSQFISDLNMALDYLETHKVSLIKIGFSDDDFSTEWDSLQTTVQRNLYLEPIKDIIKLSKKDLLDLETENTLEIVRNIDSESLRERLLTAKLNLIKCLVEGLDVEKIVSSFTDIFLSESLDEFEVEQIIRLSATPFETRMGNLKKTIHLGAINEILALVVGFYSSYSLDKILSDAIKTLGFSKVLKDAEIHRPYRDVYFQFAEDDKLDLLKQIQSEVRESVSSFQKLRLQEALNETILKYIAHPTEFSKLFGESATFKWNQLEPESRKRAKDRIVCHRKNPQIAFEDSFLTIRINDKSLKLKPQAIPIMEKLIKDYFIGGLGLNKKQLLSHDPEYGNKISDKLSGTVKSNKCTDSDLYEYSDQTGVYRLPIEY